MIDKLVIFFSGLFQKTGQKVGLSTSQESWELFLRYCVVGGTATVVDFGLLYILTEFAGFWYMLSATVSFIGGAATNYLLNRVWTFKNKDRRIARQLTIFLIIAVIGIFINNTILYIGVEFVGLWYMLAKAFSTAITLIWNFLGHKYLTFKNN